MRGADASAGTIKSGGATRRAAKMVVLDVDHPDIEEFVETKAREEDKIRALRDAGFDMDLGGKDITSRPVPERQQLGPRHRRVHARGRGGHRVRAARPQRPARSSRPSTPASCSRKIAKAAWECADPGIQYDDTINDWHTNPETGRITASNPCSEYMSLDNSSCNLAVAEPAEVPQATTTPSTRATVRQGRRAGHHRDGHLDLLRRLPDRGDRRHHPQVPPARHRLRQPRRAADGDRPGLRLRRRPRARRVDHLADDRHVVQALGRARRRRRPVRRLRPQRRRPQAGHAQARRPPTTRSARSTSIDKDVHKRGHQGVGRRRQDRRRRTASATRRPRCSRRPAPSAS